MVKTYSITEARRRLNGLVREAEEGTQVEITRWGRTVAVLTGIGDYDWISKGTTSFWDAYEKFRREHNLVELDIDPDEVLATCGIRPRVGTSTGKAQPFSSRAAFNCFSSSRVANRS